MDVEPLTVELDIGHTDKDNKVHSRVVFGKRINGARLFAIDDDPQSSLGTQYQFLLMSAAITEFGDLRIPVALKILLELDSVDGDDLSEALNRFLNESLGSRAIEYPSIGVVKLAFGYERNGITYDLVEFGKRLTGMDEVEADRQKLTGVRRVCFLHGRQIAKLKQSDGASELEGPIGLNIFEELDLVDIGAIRTAAEVWRHSFRRAGARVQ